MSSATGRQEKETSLPDLFSMGDELYLCSLKLACLANIDFHRVSLRDDATEGFRSSMDEILWKIDEIAAQLHTIYLSRRD